MNKKIIHRFYAAYICILMLFSCDVKKEAAVSAKDDSIGSLKGPSQESLDEYSALMSKRAEEGWFELEYDSGINPQDISGMGILDLTSMEQLLAVLPDEQVKYIGVINLTEENIKSFKGIERFTNLGTLGIRESSIESLEGLVIRHNAYVYLEESEIGSLTGLDNIKSLSCLSLDGSHIKDKDSIDLIGKLNSLDVIGLSRFPDYKRVLDILPATIEQISLEYNGINTIKEIEFLKEKYPSLRYVYVRGNNFTEEDVRTERANWLPAELCWWNIP